ncbi:unnamed protein product, partial [Phaeothamnion confervicola]
MRGGNLAVSRPMAAELTGSMDASRRRMPSPTPLTADSEMRNGGGLLLGRLHIRTAVATPGHGGPSGGASSGAASPTGDFHASPKARGAAASPWKRCTRSPSPLPVSDGDDAYDGDLPAAAVSPPPDAGIKRPADSALEVCASLGSCSSWDCGIGGSGDDPGALPLPTSVGLAASLAVVSASMYAAATSATITTTTSVTSTSGAVVPAAVGAPGPDPSTRSASAPLLSSDRVSAEGADAAASSVSLGRHARSSSALTEEVCLPEDIYGSVRVSEFWQGLSEYSSLANTYVYDDIWASGGLAPNVDAGLQAAQARAVEAAATRAAGAPVGDGFGGGGDSAYGCSAGGGSAGGGRAADDEAGEGGECFQADVLLEPNAFVPTSCPEVPLPVIVPSFGARCSIGGGGGARSGGGSSATSPISYDYGGYGGYSGYGF